jgi:hypothetical protein
LKPIQQILLTAKISPAVLARKLLSKFKFAVSRKSLKYRDFARPTSIADEDFFSFFRNGFELIHCFKKIYKLPSVEHLSQFKYEIKELSEKALKHEFNLLGSGWVKVCHGMQASGFEGITFQPSTPFGNISDFIHTSINPSNKDTSLAIASHISPNYNPIDWQSDIRSGYRWSESVWHREIQVAPELGADIKLPWELGRMQHLFILPFAAELSKIYPDEFKAFEEYAEEFRNEILDFIASNPPRFGVQWKSSMDAAIRAVNMIAAFCFAMDCGFEFDNEFNTLFFKSLVEHGKHIVENPEWSEGLRGNHYLSCVTGLLIIAASLEQSDLADKWLLLAIQELCSEILFQFQADGTNFEASTNYHCLSTEIALHGMITIGFLPVERLNRLKKIPKQSIGSRKILNKEKQYFSFDENGKISLHEQIIERIAGAVRFIDEIINANGDVLQIGDNDSGWFLPLTAYLEKAETKNKTGKRSILQLYDILSGYGKLTNNKNNIIETLELDIFNIGSDIHFPNIISSIEAEKLRAYNDFGLYIYQNENYRIAIRCGSVGQLGKGGHAHNDILSFTLDIGDLEIIVDTGTYVYTASPELRNLYRSTKMHNTLAMESLEQITFPGNDAESLFWLSRSKKSPKVLSFNDIGFAGVHYGFPKPCKRVIRFDKKRLFFEDSCKAYSTKELNLRLAPGLFTEVIDDSSVKILMKNNCICSFHFQGAKPVVEQYFYSRQYGEKEAAPVIKVHFNDSEIKWKIRIFNY